MRRGPEERGLDEPEPVQIGVSHLEEQLHLPATASLSISAPGYQTAERTLYLDCPELFEYYRDIGAVWPSFFSPEPYAELRRRLAQLRLKVALQPTDRR